MTGRARGTVTIVVPTRDTGRRLDELCGRLAPVLDALGRPAEVLLVDDGSVDDTWPTICRAAADPRFVGVRLERSVGQSGALLAGFEVSRGDVVVTMDDDLEVDPRELFRFVAAVEAGADLVSGRRIGARPTIRSLGSWCYNRRLRSLGFPLRDAGCGYNAIPAAMAQSMVGQGWNTRQHRCKLVAARIAPVAVDLDVPVDPTGPSHYSLFGLAASWIDVELEFGSLTRQRLVAATTAPPVLVVLSTFRRRRGIAVAALVAGAAAVTAAARALAASAALANRAATEAPFVIVERTAGGLGRRTT